MTCMLIFQQKNLSELYRNFIKMSNKTITLRVIPTYNSYTVPAEPRSLVYVFCCP